jgi:uncharacterized damage-inducible protein DinB
MNCLTRAGFALVTSAALSTSLHAQEPAAPAPQAATTGVKGDMLQQLDDAATKLIQLAEATPPEKFTWRPARGVRSVSEVYMHVTGANYLFPRFVGVETPYPLARDAETTIKIKAQVMEWLKRSFDHLRGVIQGVNDGDWDKPTKMFGRETTYRNALLTAVSHAHEHLGQSIAYARMNGITPPWSQQAGN